ncbi:MAG: hypothetical protein E3J72_02290 [Planctomycetota bacterium]|nr:MAG: hypothetical protein E3J72_02290 [Planctomycetota bacterium]
MPKKRDVLVVSSKVKKYIKSKRMKSSGSLAEALSDELYGLIDRAMKRTKENRRGTVQPRDL